MYHPRGIIHFLDQRAAFIKLTSDNDERTKRTEKLNSHHTNRKERKKSKMPKRKRKNEGGSKKDVKLLGVTKITAKKGERFKAYISIDSKSQHLGTFDTSKEAVRAYDRAAIQAGCPTSKLNFLDQVPKNYKPKKKKLSSGNTTGFRGVYKKGNRFRAQITIGGNRQSIGTFATAKEAAEAYDQAALQAKFPRSEINFSDSMEHNKKEAGEEVVVEEEEEEEGKDEEEEENEE